MTDFGRRPPVCPANVLPKTDQTTSYRDYDDGWYEAGWEGDRWTDNGDGTLTDNATGLMWGDDADGEAGGGGLLVNWFQAIDAAVGITLGGHADWRLANPREIYSLVDYMRGPAGYVGLIANIDRKSFWTSTTDDSNTDNAYSVTDHGFQLTTTHKSSPGNGLYCRAA